MNNRNDIINYKTQYKMTDSVKPMFPIKIEPFKEINV